MAMKAPLKTQVFRWGLLFFLWLVLSEGSLNGLWLGILTVTLAWAVADRQLSGATEEIKPGGLPAFFLFFAIQSLFGGLDVARRAFSPRLKVNPGVVRLELRMSREKARFFYSLVIGLFPGSVCTRLEADFIEVHVLDRSPEVIENLRQAERKVSDLSQTGPLDC
jgi:multicomponent Na+:H+ antiporter subunit E